MEIIGSLLVAAVPVVGIIGLLWLSERLRARREVGRRLRIVLPEGIPGPGRA